MIGVTPRLLHEHLDAAAAAAPDRVAVICGGRSATYAELHQRALALARLLVDRGVQRGDRVLLLLEPGVEALIALFGVLLAGAAYSFVSPQIKHDKLKFLLADAAPRAVLADAALAARFSALLSEAPDLERVLVHGAPIPDGPRFEEWSRASASEWTELPRVIPLDLSALIYTSGSTGRPKGVMMTHQTMTHSLGSLLEVLRLEDGMRTLSVLPLSFNYGMYQILLNVAVAGTLYLETSFTYPAHTLERLAAERIQAFPGVPTLLARLLAVHATSGMRVPSMVCVTNTAAALPEALAAGVQRMFPNVRLYRMYGLTECKRALYLEPELGSARPGSVGRAMPGSEVFLRTPEGQVPEPGEPGILHVRGPGVMLGYWNLPDETERVLRPGRYPGERVFVTGDWFKVDADGFYTFLGRSDDIIKTRGEKVSPAEVEAALLMLEGVREVAVVGVPDDVLGEAVRAYVALEPGSTLQPAAIRRHCGVHLEPFMVPRDICLMPELPKTDTGKIDKPGLRARAREG